MNFTVKLSNKLLGNPIKKLKYTNYEEPISLKDFNDGKERIVFIMCPSWTIAFPPIGLSKMVGNTRDAGFACKVYDLNIQTYHYLLDKVDKNYWRSENQFYWQNQYFYETNLASLVNPYILKVIDRLVEDNPTIIGLSFYATSTESSIYLIKKIRERLPDVKIIIGGPYASLCYDDLISNRFNNNYVDFVFIGESEETFLDFLKNENKKEKFIGKTGGKINLDNKSFADYSDYDLSAYTEFGKVGLETSRGCIAKCVFCNEKDFWKFRTINPLRVIEEIKHQIREHGIINFEITDSLINGDLKHLSKLIDLMISNNLNINWYSYIRCDGRMDEDFLFRMSKSGCKYLSFGVESGSEKVLLDMKKGIKIFEIEENIKNAFNNKIWTQVNWIIGFPTEGLIDYYHSNILIYNLRKYISSLAPGMGCQLVESDLSTNHKLYNIVSGNQYYQHLFINGWYTSDFKNTHLNRFLRLKLCHIYLLILESNADSKIYNGQKYDNTGDSFEFHTKNKNTEEYLVQEKNIDFNVIKITDDIMNFSVIVGNEFFSAFYVLYKIFGGFDIKLIFDPVKNFESWGTLSDNYQAIVTFNIDDSGEYNCIIDHEFKHYGMSPDLEVAYNIERNEIGDMSFKNYFNLYGNISDWLVEAST